MTTTPSPYREGYVLVQRRWKPIESGRRGGRMRFGWTLHVADCRYAKGANRSAVPAPIVPYPDTQPCVYCRPDSGHTPRRTDNGDGTVTMACECGGTATANSYDIARRHLVRWHEEHPDQPEETDARITA